MSTSAEEAPVSSTVELQPQLHRKIEFLPHRRQYNGITTSFGEFAIETLNPGISEVSRAASRGNARTVKAEASTEARSVAGELYEHGFDSELSFRISFQKIGAGLENLGNTCYLNSVLQCLTYTEPFVAYLQSGNHKSTCRNAGFCAMCALQNHVVDARKSTGKILRPFNLVKNLRCISRNFRNFRQEDAHEYMVNLLESMHKCCLPNGVQSESPSAYEKSQVHKIFGGQLRSQVKCEQCSYSSNKFDPFLDLSLEIMKADSLGKALAHFTAKELLDGGERHYQCQRCKEKVRAFKQLTIHKAPYVLTIHLKRFGSTHHGEKLNKKVEYGPKLDLNPFISEPHEGDYRYTLYGVLVHAGWSTHSGHYFCYVRTSAGTWYSLDDNQVTQVSEKAVLSREAYMLFYVSERKFPVKRSVVSVSKPGIFSSSPGNKATPLKERQPNSAVHSSVKTNNEETCSDFVSAMEISLQQSVKNVGLLSHHKKQVETKWSSMQIDGDAITNTNETSSSKDSAKSLYSVDFKLPSDDDKKNTVTNASVTNTCETLSSKDSAKSLYSVDFKLPSDDDKKNNVTNASAQDTVLARRLETDHPLPQNNIAVITKPCALNGSIQTDTVDTKMENQNNSHDSYEFKSRSFNPHLQNGGESFPKLMKVDSLLSSTPACCVEQDTPADVITKKSLYNCHQIESKFKKPRKVLLTKGPYFGRNKLFFMSLHFPKKKHIRSKKHRLKSRNSRGKTDDPQTDLCDASTSECFQTIDVACKHHPHKHSKHIRSKKHRLKYRNSRGKTDDPQTDLCDASTSECFQTIDVACKHHPHKHSHSSACRKSKGKVGAKISSSAVHNKVFHTSMNSVMPSKKSGSFWSKKEEALVKIRSAGDADNHIFSEKLQMANLNETSVTESVDKNPQTDHMTVVEENPKRSIGYVLDVWDETDDKGKRKKKKSKHSFGFIVHNPFQEMASINTRLKKSKVAVHRKSSGDQPFRI